MELVKPSNAERAFIYQQTQDLLASIPAGTHIPMSVFLEKVDASSDSLVKKSRYLVTFALLNAPASTMFAQHEAETLEEACMGAKNQMKEKIHSLFQLTKNLRSRDEIIEAIKVHPYLH